MCLLHTFAGSRHPAPLASQSEKPRHMVTGLLEQAYGRGILRSGVLRDFFASEVQPGMKAGTTSSRSHTLSFLPSSPLSSRTHSPFYLPRFYLLVDRSADPALRNPLRRRPCQVPTVAAVTCS